MFLKVTNSNDCATLIEARDTTSASKVWYHSLLQSEANLQRKTYKRHKATTKLETVVFLELPVAAVS